MNRERLTLRDLQNSKEMFVSARVASEVMCVRYKTFLNWLNDGKLPEIKMKRINGRWMIYRLPLIEYIMTGDVVKPEDERRGIYDAHGKRIL